MITFYVGDQNTAVFLIKIFRKSLDFSEDFFLIFYL